MVVIVHNYWGKNIIYFESNTTKHNNPNKIIKTNSEFIKITVTFYFIFLRIEKIINIFIKFSNLFGQIYINICDSNNSINIYQQFRLKK